MIFYSYFDGKTVFSQISLGFVFCFIGGVGWGGGGGVGGESGGQITASFTSGMKEGDESIFNIDIGICLSHSTNNIVVNELVLTIESKQTISTEGLKW